MRIHKEGFLTILLTLLFLAAVNALIIWLLPQQVILQKIVLVISLILYIIVLQFFRNPVRITPINASHVIAPADGKVVVIEEVVETEFFKEKRRQISIFMSPFNVHVNRNPVSGIVKYFKYHPGKYLVAWHPKSSTENERTTVVLETEKGETVLFRQIAGALARRICWYINPGQKVKQGEEFGFIKFGSRVDIFVPLNAQINVKIGDVTTGGKTVIAEFKS